MSLSLCGYGLYNITKRIFKVFRETESIKRQWNPGDQSWTGSPLKYMSIYEDNLLIEKLAQGWYEEDWQKVLSLVDGTQATGNK